MVAAELTLDYRDTFWMKFPNSKQKEHLYFIITIPSHSGGQALIVNMTTTRNPEIPLCELNIGDHRSVKTKSYINYAALKAPNVTALAKAFMTHKTHLLRWDRKASPALIERIQNVALTWELLEPPQAKLIRRAMDAS